LKYNNLAQQHARKSVRVHQHVDACHVLQDTELPNDTLRV